MCVCVCVFTFIYRFSRYESYVMDMMNQTQILDKIVCVSLHTYALRKGMNPCLPPQDIGKQ